MRYPHGLAFLDSLPLDDAPLSPEGLRSRFEGASLQWDRAWGTPLPIWRRIWQSMASIFD